MSEGNYSGKGGVCAKGLVSGTGQNAEIAHSVGRVGL